MVGDGVVSLDSRLSDFLPTGMQLTGGQGAFSLKQLATHTAGLPRLPPGMMTLGAVARGAIGMNPYASYGVDDLLQDLPATTLIAVPGRRLV